jgi:two-component system, LytTR family, response regulator
MTLRTLIVDDEPVARNVLREELELIGDVQVIGEAGDGETALAAIAGQHPDLVLLDLQMPGMSGFEVVRALERMPLTPVIIIVTAFDQHALDAFDAGAVDYLLKPVGEERLHRALDRVRRLGAGSPEAADRLVRLQEVAGGSAPPRITGRSGNEYVLLSPREIFAFQAEGELVWILTAAKKYLATCTLRELQERLRLASFRRVHRGALVNMDHARKLASLSSQRWLLTLNNGLEFIVSKRLAHNVRQFLKW